MAQEKFDVVVVGAGPAGCTVAYQLAKHGLRVLVVERGRYAGSKNMMGGILYSHPLSNVIPEFWREAPIERPITRHVLMFLSGEDSLSIDYRTKSFGIEPYNGFSVLRGQFDRWFAEKVKDAGAIVISGVRVDDIVWDGRRAVGVAAGGERIACNVVVIAEGSKAQLAQQTGLRESLSSNEVAVGVKQVFELPRETIEERFNLSQDEGAAYTSIGNLGGVCGGGFIYTNKSSVSLGVVSLLSSITKLGARTSDLIEEFRSYPDISKLVKGGKLREYSALTLHEGGFEALPQLYSDGLILCGTAASLMLNAGFTLRGADFAVASGLAAAQAITNAVESGDFSRKSLSAYERLLRESIVTKDMKTYKRMPILFRNERIYSTYPKILCDLMRELYSVDGTPKRRIFDSLKHVTRGRLSWISLLSDAFGLATTL